MSSAAEKGELHDEACPLVAVDRRLDDVHRHWHSAERAYFEPQAFRVAIQTAIQTLRTVTFIIQSNKRVIADFDHWYEPWQEKLKADALMRWMVDARNKIEKQGDLEAHSFVRAEIVASYLNNGPVIEVPAKLFDGAGFILKNIPREAVRSDHVKRFGTLRIQRRWVENTLPDYELLEAVGIAYGRIAEVVHDAHRRIGREPPITINVENGEQLVAGLGGRLPCMIGHEDARTVNISISDGKRFEISRTSVRCDQEAAQEGVKRYGLRPEDIWNSEGGQVDVLKALFNAARVMTEKDGRHVTMIVLLRGSQPVQLAEVEFPDQGAKYVIMRGVANDVIKLGVDGVILIGEAWLAVADPNNPYMRAADAPHKVEILRATLVRRDGDPVELSAQFNRRGDQVRLGKTETTSEGQHYIHYIFAPVYHAWGRDLPKDWEG
ncbi:hypothetical protein [Rhodopseudomonas palustris]|uniref:hypothetical protein n=1 Tax=Rhodopseudomonas palustris TaxID=1076 RepID=UPI000D1A8396|nr:hypothetical protein [Rhodopseudomonas palustris]AVT82994.1 hypothetical protein RPYSC3_41340 [Rhodopseudomonas palustris]